MGDLVTYRAFRMLLPARSLAREYARSEITSSPAIGNVNPADARLGGYNAERGPRYEQLRAGAFSAWRLKVEGRVARPAGFSLAELKAFPSRTQITKHTCEEGWSAIAEWTGVPLRHVLDAVGILPSARFVNFYAYDDTAEGLDMLDALHPQTLLAYSMNGAALPLETQLGYKSVKFLDRIVVKDEFDDLGKIGSLQNGWAWYTGI
jgi:DMSO/TMAO reductase YedYZ molybdopterin-dependent catalytic subunit